MKTWRVLHFIWKTNTFPFWIFFHARCWFSALLILHHTSSLTSRRNMKSPKHKYEIFSNSGQFSCLRPAMPVIALSAPSFTKWGELPQIRCFTESTAWFSSIRFFPKNRKTTGEQIQWWIRDHKCWRVIPASGLDSGNGFLSKDGIQQQIQGHRRTDPDIGQNLGIQFRVCRFFGRLICLIPTFYCRQLYVFYYLLQNILRTVL